MKNIILQTKEDLVQDENGAEEYILTENIKKEKSKKGQNKKVKKSSNKKTKKHSKIKIIFIILLLIALIAISTLSFLLYGPWPNFRDWLVTSAMTTMNHQYLATWFYTEDEIQEILENNKVIETSGITDVSKIDTSTDNSANSSSQTQYANEYERQVLEHDEDDDYKIIEIKGKNYSGYLAVIYDASKVKVAVSKNTGVTGQYLTDIAEQNDAQLAINGGGFLNESNGATPMGLTIVDGEVVSNNKYTNSGGLIGFTEDNKLVLGRLTVAQAKSMKIRDAVSFGPYLILNGEASRVVGNGGWGTAPRTVIGQRQDGIVLFLVLDGDRTKGQGAQINDLIDIMEQYGAYNAANLDGGTSTAMVEDGEIINDPIDASGNHRTRHIASAFILTK